jgi:hypothetical protein
MNISIFLDGHIFSLLVDYLNDKEIIRLCLLTNKNFKNMLPHISNRNILFYEYFNFIITLSKLDNTTKLNSIVKLDFSDENNITQSVLLNLLNKCPNLKYIDLSNIQMIENEEIMSFDSIINYISLNYPNLSQCNIYGIKISINCLNNYFEKFNQLEEFSINSYDINQYDINGIINDDIILRLVKLKKTLKYLCLEECSLITSKSLIPFLKDNKTIETLELRNCKGLDNSIIKPLLENNCTKLSRVSIINANVNVHSIELLKSKHNNMYIEFNEHEEIFDTWSNSSDESEEYGDFFQIGYNEDWVD